MMGFTKGRVILIELILIFTEILRLEYEMFPWRDDSVAPIVLYWTSYLVSEFPRVKAENITRH